MIHRSRFILAALLGAISVSGCAVLTVDVDVYKGALSNHESVQNEQVAAMAMGAKPLLAELRYRLEKVECPGPECESTKWVESSANFLPTEKLPLKSRDARTVNEILYLYEDQIVKAGDARAAIDASHLLSSLADAAKRLLRQFEEGMEIVSPYIVGGSQTQKEKRAEALAERAREVQPFQFKAKDAFGVPEPDPRQIEAVKLAWRAAEDVWQEAIRVLASDAIRSRLSNDIIWDVAWIAADLTSGEGLRRLLSDDSRLASLKTGPLMEIRATLSILTNNNRPLTFQDEEAVGAVLAQVLADPKRGPALASQLAMAQSYAKTNPKRDWFVAIYPSKESLDSVDGGMLTDVKDFDRDWKSLASKMAIALGAGRPERGLERLIEEYLRVSRLSGGSQGSKETSKTKRELLDGLINFAEKVTIIANYDTLLRDQHEDTRKYVRVLQAIGNSILSQVDALRQSEAHRDQLTRTRDTEVAGIRNAEVRGRAVLKQITAELMAKDSFPDKDAILEVLRLGQRELDNIVSRIGAITRRERALLEAERATTAKWATTNIILTRKDIKSAVEEYGKAPAKRTASEVAGEIKRLLKIWEGEAALLGGTGEEEAKRLERSATALGELTFPGDSSGAVKEKYLDIVSQINRKLVTARAAKNKEDINKWETVRDVIVQPKVRDSVQIYGMVTVPRTTAEVVGEIGRVLRGQDRSQGGAGDEEARRLELQKVNSALVELTFPADTSGAVQEKYQAIMEGVNSKLVNARAREKALEAPVADLERWHGQVTVLNNQAHPNLSIPTQIEKDKSFDGNQRPNAKDVLDVMVATLRYEHVNAMKEHGPDNPITKNLAAAVELNYAYRSGMVHIRPASVFLRNSYPATILQQDPSAGVWRNMLTDHAKRQLPLYDWWQGQKEEAKINNAIDKQFWQSVNQVRVAGAGDTNYAIVKDDVGNWYVKSYSSDPAPIIKSAKNLAMFSAGSAMGANFLSKGGEPGTADGSIPQEIKSTIGRQLALVSERYEKATREVRADLAKEIGNINATIRNALAGGKLTADELKEMFPDPKETQTEVKNGKPEAKDTNPNPELAELMKKLKEDKIIKDEKPKEANQKDGKLKPVSVLNAEIAKGLKAIKSYRTAVQNKLNMKIASEDKPAATSPAAKTTPAPSPATPAPVAPPPPTANPALPPPPAPSPPNTVAPSVPNPAAPAAPIPAAPNQAATPSPAPNPPAPTQAAPAPAETKSTDTKKLNAKEGEEAKKAVDKVFKDLLEKFISERKTTNAEYESALQLMHEFAEL